MFTRYQCRCAAAGGQRPRARGLHHPQHDRLRHGRPHRRPVRVVQCALQKFYSKGNMIGDYANINILDRKISATLLTLTVDVICTIMFMQKPFGLSKNMRLKCTIVHYTCSVEMPAACSSMQWVMAAANTTLWCPAVTTSTATEAAHGLQSKVAQSEL